MMSEKQFAVESTKYGLGETKSYYCKGDYIWLDENRNITSKSRQDGDNDE